MNINQLQELGKVGVNRFRAIGPDGEKEGEWLDAWMGFLKFDGTEGFMIVQQFIFLDQIDWIPIGI